MTKYLFQHFFPPRFVLKLKTNVINQNLFIIINHNYNSFVFIRNCSLTKVIM